MSSDDPHTMGEHSATGEVPAVDGTSAASETPKVGDVAAVLDQLRVDACTLPEEAIQQARLHREAIIPGLIEFIEQATSAVAAGQELPHQAHFIAVYLLYEFRATEAWPALRASLALPDELPYELYEDALASEFSVIMAALCGGRWEELELLVRNPNIDHFVRWTAINAMVVLVRDGKMDREMLIEKLQAYLEAAIAEGDELVSPLVITLTELGAVAARPLIERAYDDGVMDERMLSHEEAMGDIEEDHICERTLANLPQIEDAISGLGEWIASQGPFDYEDYEDYEDDDDYEADDEFRALWEQAKEEVLGGELITTRIPEGACPPPTIRNEGPKVGRNDPCPCGSGKKYKKCCGRA